MGRSVGKNLWLIFWKNLILRKRQYVVTSMEILLPTLFACFLAYIRSQLKVTEDGGTSERIFPVTMEEDILKYARISLTRYATERNNQTSYLGFIPDTEVVRRFVQDELGPLISNISSDYELDDPHFEWKGFSNDKELEAFVAEQGLNEYDDSFYYDAPKLTFALVITGLLNTGQSYGKNHKISYKIRLLDQFYDTKQLMPSLILGAADCQGDPAGNYIYSGFSAIQIILDKLLIGKLTNTTPEFTLNSQTFPCPRYDGFDFNQLYFFLLPQLMTLGFIFIVPSIVRGIVSEKETGIKELMKMIGLPNYLHWIGWMLNSLSVLLISITIVVILFFIPFNSNSGAVMKNSDPSLWWFFFFVYAIWATTYCFLISSVFVKPTLATTVGIVIWLLSYYGVALPMEQNYDDLSLGSKMLLCLSPNMGLHYGLKVLSAFEAKKGIGAQWKYFGSSINSVDSLSLAHVVAMLFVTSIVYTLLAMYLEAILPSKYGVKKPFYFLFMPSTWGLGKKRHQEHGDNFDSGHGSQVGNSFEAVETNLPVGLEIINLRKQFGKKIAVDDISMKAYEGQIFCLLGHNGAGKSCLLSILMGLQEATNGTAMIYDKNIRTEMSEIRQDLGVCPQQNFLFAKLTVAEHLRFFGMVKGLSNSEAKQEVDLLIAKLQLEEKTNVISESLSGGQKRRLCLGCAIIGRSKVLFLDECSSGLDPEARRVIWDLLLELRAQKTIILTTHFLEEADVLGDRVAIMAAGKIQCCGSPSFLKKFYGTGYTLSISMGRDGDSENVLRLVQDHNPTASIKFHVQKDNVKEFGICIPHEEHGTARFSACFSELFRQKSALKILDVGISLTTMDEVFLKVDEIGHTIDSSQRMQNGSSSNPTSSNYRRVDGISLGMQQLLALTFKKMLYSARRWKLTLCQMALPVLLTIAAVAIVNIFYGQNDQTPPLTLLLSSYKNQIVLYSTSSQSEALGNVYSEVVGPPSKKIPDGSNLTLELLTVSRTAEDSYFQRYLVAAEFGQFNITSMYSSLPPHVNPLSINLVTNSMLRHYDKGNGYTLEVTNHPLSSGRNELLDAATFNPSFAETAPFVVGILVSIGLSLLAAGFIVMPIEERICQSKQLQLMTGVNPLIYWGSAIIWDYFMFLLCTTLMVSSLFIFEKYHGFTNNGGAGVAFLIILIYGIGAISFSYMLSLLAVTPSGGFALTSIIHLISGTGMAIAVYVMQDDIALASPARAVGWIGRIFPTYGISKSLMVYARISTRNSRCSALSDDIKAILCRYDSTNIPPGYQACCDNCEELGSECFKAEPYLKWETQEPSMWNDNPIAPGIAQELFFMSIMSIAYFTLLMIVEFGWSKWLLNKIWKQKAVEFQTNSNDEDVRAEAERVRNMAQENCASEDALIVQDLCKSYGEFSAVSRVSFAVHHGECFGLLGVNGAGKTTTFRMLTGDEIISNGNAWISNLSLQENRSKFLRKIGYCPQFDGLIGVLSGKQMLIIFALLRGVRIGEVGRVAETWLHRFGLHESGNEQCQNYSGGMKRRLSAAMAIIGDPPIIFMDEPTSGVDPASRRQFWGIISSLKDAGRSIILTSHSMEECENLCSRLGIMVNGELQCLGRVQHLKNKFAQGYSLTIRLKPIVSGDETSRESVFTALAQQVITKLNPSTLKDHHQNIVQFHVQTTEIGLDKVFEIMEGIKSEFASYIEEYSIQQTTLEEVFLSFARKQYGDLRQVQSSTLRKFISCVFGC